jgi:hypothetical protein
MTFGWKVMVDSKLESIPLSLSDSRNNSLRDRLSNSLRRGSKITESELVHKVRKNRPKKKKSGTKAPRVSYSPRSSVDNGSPIIFESSKRDSVTFSPPSLSMNEMSFTLERKQEKKKKKKRDCNIM